MLRSMMTVASYPTVEEAALAASRLESAGIETFLKDDLTVSSYWFYSPAVGGVKVAVNDDDVPSAREILQAPTVETGLLVCPHCGSSRVRTRVLSPVPAVSIVLLGWPIPWRQQTVDCLDCRRSHVVPAHPSAR